MPKNRNNAKMSDNHEHEEPVQSSKNIIWRNREKRRRK